MEVPLSPEVGEQLPVQVLLRVKPLTGQRETIVVHQGPRTIKVCNPVQSTSANGESLLVSKRLEYSFDWVLPETSSQTDTFRKSCPSMMRHFMSGGNALLFCYGPSASGKTYTILGDDKNPGVLPNILRSLFKSIEIANLANSKTTVPESKSNSDVSIFPLLPGMEYHVWISYLECYNERIFDLLKNTKSRDAPVPLDIKYTKNHVPIVPSNEPKVEAYNQAMQWLTMGQGNRQTGSTQINKSSSRSHAIFTIKLTQTPIGATEEELRADPSLVRYSKFSIVDLAGSERSTKSQATGDRLREASNINNSLLTLKRCMKALQQNQMAIQANAALGATGSVTDSTQKRLSVNRRISTDKGLGNSAQGGDKPALKQLEVVPFRDSTLTKILREFLQGEGKCSVIVTINPSAGEYEESLQALDFGTITKAVKTTTCKKKIITKSASPPQAIPFSLAGAGGVSGQGANLPSGARSVNRKASAASMATAAMNLEKLAGMSLNNSLNQSLNHSISEASAKPKPIVQGNSRAPSRAVSAVPAEVEASSPSKSALNRSRMLNTSLGSPKPVNTSTLSMFQGDCDFKVSTQLNFGDVDDESSLEISGYDELELAVEINKLRVALADAENRIVEAEMSVRAELAQEMANRILEMEAFYRAQSESRVRNTQTKYEKLLEHYHQAYTEEQDMIQAHTDSTDVEVEEAEESRSTLLNRLAEKEVTIEATQTELDTLRGELSEMRSNYQQLQESTHRMIRELRDQHREEVSVLRMQADTARKEAKKGEKEIETLSLQLEAKKHDLDALRDELETHARDKELNEAKMKKELETLRKELADSKTSSEASGASSSMSVDEEADAVPVAPAKKRRGRKAEPVVETVEEVEDAKISLPEASSSVAEEEKEVVEVKKPAAKKRRGKEAPKEETIEIAPEAPVERVVEEEIEVPEPKKSAAAKKRRGKEVVPKSKAKASKLKENSTPSAEAAAAVDSADQVEEAGSEAAVDDEIVERPRRGGRGVTAKSTGPVGIKRTKAIKSIVVEEKSEAEEEMLDEEAEEALREKTPVKAVPKFGAPTRRLASPSSPHLALSPPAKAPKKIKVLDADDEENVPESNKLKLRTPMSKRLRSRRPMEVLDSDVEESPIAIKQAAPGAGKRRGAGAAPRYLGRFL